MPVVAGDFDKPRRVVVRNRRVRGRKLNKRQLNQVKRIVHSSIEDKSLDVAVSTAAIDYTTGVIANLQTGLVRGNAEQSNYIGGKITPTKLMIRYQILGADTTNMVRIVVLQNKANAGVPTAATVFESVSNIRAPLSAFEINFNDTYRVLYDRLHNLVLSGDTAQRTGMIRLFRKKLHPIIFDATNALEAYGLWLVAISDSSAVTHPTLQLYSRLTYEDA